MINEPGDPQPIEAGGLNVTDIASEGGGPATGGGGNGGDPLESITVSVTVEGNGSVTSDPEGIDCGDDCEATFEPVPDEITLTPVADANWNFVSWSGDCEGTRPCVVPYQAEVNTTATFSNNPVLTVTKTGDGQGEVTSDPAGIDCDLGCTDAGASFEPGTTITLTVTEAVGSDFTGWSGADCSGTGTCEISLEEVTTVTANFDLEERTLSLRKSGDGQGTVTSNPSAISCGTSCDSQNRTFPYGTVVALSAGTDATGSDFDRWTGVAGCNSSRTCNVTLTSDVTATANYDLETRLLTVSKTNSTRGQVTSSPSGVSCGSDCSQNYDYGTSVTLSASPTSGWSFTEWSSGCSGSTSPTCVLNMTSNRSANAVFRQTRSCSQLSNVRACPNGTSQAPIVSGQTATSCRDYCGEWFTRINSVGCWTLAGGGGSTCYCRASNYATIQSGFSAVGGNCL